MSCTSLRCNNEDYCISRQQFSDDFYSILKSHISGKGYNTFVLLTSTFFDLDSMTNNKKKFDVFLLGPNYNGLIDSTGYKQKFPLPDDYAIAYTSVVKSKVAPRRYPLLHCHIDNKIIFIQSTIDDFVSNPKSIEFFRNKEIPSYNGRFQFMRESMCIIKHPNGTIKTFIVGDTILTEEKLREHF